jgi:hypothetical protein
MTMRWLRKFKRLPNVRDWFRDEPKAFAAVPKPDDPNRLAKGKLLFVEGVPEPVLVERVTGNIADPSKFEINGQYLINMLDFYTQVTENRRPTAEEREEWNSIELLQVDPPGDKKKLRPKENQ